MPSITATPAHDAVLPAACSVRVTGLRAGRWIEFEFSAGDPDLAVELVLAPEQFDEFCRTQRAVRLDADGIAR